MEIINNMFIKTASKSFTHIPVNKTHHYRKKNPHEISRHCYVKLVNSSNAVSLTINNMFMKKASTNIHTHTYLSIEHTITEKAT